MAKDPQKPDVLERGAYSKTHGSEATDSTAYETGTPMGHDRLEDGRGGRGAAPELISRDKLARARELPEPERALSRNAKLGIGGGVLVLVVVAATAFALWPEAVIPPPQAPVPTVEPVPEPPRDLNGVPVERGLRSPTPKPGVAPTAQPGAAPTPKPSGAP